MSTTLNLTVFIGNGFDLSAGMKTGTAEFMDFFANKHERDGDPSAGWRRKFLRTGHKTGLTSRRSSESMLRLSKRPRRTQPAPPLTAKAPLTKR